MAQVKGRWVVGPNKPLEPTAKTRRLSARVRLQPVQKGESTADIDDLKATVAHAYQSGTMLYPRAAILLLALSIPFAACGKSPEDARRELAKLGVEYTEKAFVEAAKNNDTLAVRLFLEAGMNPNARDDEYNSALFYAVAHGNIDTVRFMLDKGADVNAPSGENDYTPLMTAAGARDKDRIDIVNLLLDRGADINKQTRHGFTALIGAARFGNAATMERLLSEGADVNLKRWDDSTALMDAADSDHPDIVTALIEKHTDVNACNIHGDTALMMASSGGYETIVRILLDAGADPNQKYLANQQKKAAMYEKFKFRDFDPVRMRDIQGRTAIMFAAEKGHAAIVKRLLGAGADPHVRDTRGITALSLARKGGHTEVVKLLE